MLEKTPPSPLASKEIKPVTGKVPDAAKDRGQNTKGASEDEMAGWHHQCNGHELRQTLGDGKGQRGLVC